MERQTQTYNGGVLEITHKFGNHEGQGDTTMTASAHEDSFNLDLSRHLGRDRDNYDHSADAEIDLNEEEARDLHLLLHIWLERRMEVA